MPYKTLCFIIICLAVFWTAPGLRADNFIRAKIGIQVKSGQTMSMAKPKEILQAGDLFRIYISTEKKSLIYIIHADDTSVSLLHRIEQKVQSPAIVLPSYQTYFQADGSSSLEKITIICSPSPLPELAPFETGGLSLKQWELIKKDLKQKSRMIQPMGSEKPFPIAGNVRGASEGSFAKNLPIYSGKGLLIKNYEFKVKK